MVHARYLLTALAVVLAGCAGVAPTPQTDPSKTAASINDVRQLRQDLEVTYSNIVSGDAAAGSIAVPRVAVIPEIPIPNHRTVNNAVTLFSTRLRNDIQAYLDRSAQYRSMIESQIAEAGLPRELAYLPVIESGFFPTITSRAGARGIWQFMGDTAREYGLRVDWWVDERADPARSTRAALEYIKDLYRDFNDWPLALAAYNAGRGRIRRALADTGTTTFWELAETGAISRETQGYVPTFFATLIIAKNPAAYGFRIPEARTEPETRILDVEGPVSLKYLAQAGGVDQGVVRALNPGLRRGVLPPGHSSVRLPAPTAEALNAQLASLRNDDSDIAVCSFTMRNGDKLERIARAVGVSVDTILEMNNLRSKARVTEGSAIYLPVRARDLGNLLNAEETYYAVKKGDTLFSIARAHDLTIDELREINGLDRSEKIHKGQKLRVTAPRTLTAGGM